MCSTKSIFIQPAAVNANASTPAATMISDINGRQVLQPAINRGPARSSLQKNLPLPKSITIVPLPPQAKSKPPLQPAIKRGGNNRSDSMSSSSTERLLSTSPKKTVTSPNSLVVKYSSDVIVNAPGSIAAARREQVAVMKVQRKMKIAHYGRSKSAKYDSCKKLTSLLDPQSLNDSTVVKNVNEVKRCSFITPYSDPIYVAYHDEEWGIPVHDDKLLFELLVLTCAQVGSDWTSVLNKRKLFREAFSGFDAEIVSEFTDIKQTSTSSTFGIDAGFIRSVVDNSNCIIKVKKEFESFNKYIWQFVNHKPIMTNYKVHHKMPVKTSKSEAISKDMVRRGFRQVGPTVIHSFMQAAGLTNDHLITCSRHRVCASHRPRSTN